jgi:hypothetical protein
MGFAGGFLILTITAQREACTLGSRKHHHSHNAFCINRGFVFAQLNATAEPGLRTLPA